MRSSYVSVPLRGVGCFPMTWTVENINKFPSPCGVWVVSPYIYKDGIATGFPSPCGVWVVSSSRVPGDGILWVSVPLRGVGCFDFPEYKLQGFWFPSPCGVWVVSQQLACRGAGQGFRPLAGCGLFRRFGRAGAAFLGVSVPLRGVGCFNPSPAGMTYN